MSNIHNYNYTTMGIQFDIPLSCFHLPGHHLDTMSPVLPPPVVEKEGGWKAGDIGKSVTSYTFWKNRPTLLLLTLTLTLILTPY